MSWPAGAGIVVDARSGADDRIASNTICGLPGRRRHAQLRPDPADGQAHRPVAIAELVPGVGARRLDVVGGQLGHPRLERRRVVWWRFLGPVELHNGFIVFE